jgi:hypothetical protein
LGFYLAGQVGLPADLLSQYEAKMIKQTWIIVAVTDIVRQLVRFFTITEEDRLAAGIYYGRERKFDE